MTETPFRSRAARRHSALEGLPASRPLRALVVGAVLLSAACGPSNLASQVAEAPAYDPAGQAKCGVLKSGAKPLIIEWPPAERASLESRMKQGMVAVRFDGCELSILSRCKGPAGYDYVGTTRQDERVLIDTADDLYVNLPIYAATLEGKLATAGRLTVDTSMVGMYQVPDEYGVGSVDLKGECGGATHVVVGMTAGAFEMFAGSGAEVGAKAEVMGAGVGGVSKHKSEALSRGGDRARCDAARSDDQAPPDGCGAILRIEVVPLTDSGVGGTGLFQGRAADDDGDGISNSRDLCPQVKEDPDGFDDEDGCPEDGGSMGPANEESEEGE